MRLTSIPLLALIATFAPAQAASIDSPPRYHVRLTLSDGTRVIASPTITLDAGSIATVSSGPDGYNIAVTAVPSWQHPANRIALSTNVLVGSGKAGVPQSRRLARTVEVAANEPIQFELPADSATNARAFDVEFRIAPITDPR